MPFKCFNCGKVGHFQDNCPYPKKDYQYERGTTKTFKKREKTSYKKNHYKGTNFYSKEEESKSNESNDSDEEEVLFLGIEEVDEHEEDTEIEVNMEA